MKKTIEKIILEKKTFDVVDIEILKIHQTVDLVFRQEQTLQKLD